LNGANARIGKHTGTEICTSAYSHSSILLMAFSSGKAIRLYACRPYSEPEFTELTTLIKKSILTIQKILKIPVQTAI
jgi:hypothetical protein